MPIRVSTAVTALLPSEYCWVIIMAKNTQLTVQIVPMAETADRMLASSDTSIQLSPVTRKFAMICGVSA